MKSVSPLQLGTINQALAHIVPFLPDIRFSSVRVDVNFHVFSTRRKSMRVAPHEHVWWDVSMVREGSVCFKWAGGSVVPSHKEIMVFPAGHEHAWEARRAPLVMESFMLGVGANDPAGKALIEAMAGKARASGYRFALPAAVLQRREECWRALTRPNNLPLMTHRVGLQMELLAVELLAHIFSDVLAEENTAFHREINQSNSNAKLAMRMQEYLRNHLDQPISAKHLQEQFGYSKRHSSRIFKEETGFTIQEFLLEKRIKTACDLLANTDLRTKEVAQRVGFSDVSYFCRVFRTHTLCTPRNFQMQHRR